MRNIFFQENSIWTYQHWCYILKSDGHRFPRPYWSNRSCLFGWCYYVFQEKIRSCMSSETNIWAVLKYGIAKNGIKIDPERVKSITQISFPINMKVMKSFLGNINFLRKFISDYAQIVRPIQEMIRKYATYKWDKREKDAFT